MPRVQKAHNIVLYTLLVAVAIITAYVYEKHSDPDTNFKLYGYITTKAEYTFPERIESMSFGWLAGDSTKIQYVDQLWCASIDSDSDDKDLIDTRVVTIDHFEFNNTLPVAVGEKIEAAVFFPKQLGLITRQKVREVHDAHPYKTWFMDDIRPREDSICNIRAQATTFSTIFGIPKVEEFIGHDFRYTYPDTENDD